MGWPINFKGQVIFDQHSAEQQTSPQKKKAERQTVFVSWGIHWWFPHWNFCSILPSLCSNKSTVNTSQLSRNCGPLTNVCILQLQYCIHFHRDAVVCLSSALQLSVFPLLLPCPQAGLNRPSGTLLLVPVAYCVLWQKKKVNNACDGRAYLFVFGKLVGCTLRRWWLSAVLAQYTVLLK